MEVAAVAIAAANPAHVEFENAADPDENPRAVTVLGVISH
jgi:hypothetical protein